MDDLGRHPGAATRPPTDGRDGIRTLRLATKRQALADMNLHACLRKFIPKTMDRMGSGAMAEAHVFGVQGTQCFDRAFHAFGRSNDEMKAADKCIDRHFSRLLEDMVQRIHRTRMGASEYD